jgi:hypothetical protein
MTASKPSRFGRDAHSLVARILEKTGEPVSVLLDVHGVLQFALPNTPAQGRVLSLSAAMLARSDGSAVED